MQYFAAGSINRLGLGWITSHPSCWLGTYVMSAHIWDIAVLFTQHFTMHFLSSIQRGSFRPTNDALAYTKLWLFIVCCLHFSTRYLLINSHHFVISLEKHRTGQSTNSFCICFQFSKILQFVDASRYFPNPLLCINKPQ